MYLITSIIILVIVTSIPFGFEDKIKDRRDFERFFISLSGEDKMKVLNLAMAKISAILTFIMCFLIWI